MSQQGGPLVPYEGLGVDPISFLAYLLFLPLRIAASLVQGMPLPPLPSGQHQPRDFIVEAPDYRIEPVESRADRPAPPVVQAPAATYSNEESWEIEWSEDGLPTKITVHRNAQRT